MTESLVGAASMRAYAVSHDFATDFQQKIDDHARCTITRYDMARWRTIRLEAMGNATLALAAIASVLSMGHVDPGLVGVALVTALVQPRLLDKFVSFMSDVETEGVSVERVLEYCRLPAEGAWHVDGVADDWPEAGGVQVRGLSCRYREDAPLVLRDVCTSIEAGSTVGVVGRTGAGKSSLTLALLRALEPCAGQVLIDGVDLARVGLHQLRSRVTLVPQEPLLWSGSLRQNVDPLGAHSDERLWTVLEQVRLSEWTRRQDLGLDTWVREGGSNLSAGQRQLLCLARALLRPSRLLLMDEATACMDMAAAGAVQRALRQHLPASATVVTIAHRLHSVLDADRVLVMRDGSVVESAPPAVLLRDRRDQLLALPVCHDDICTVNRDQHWTSAS